MRTLVTYTKCLCFVSLSEDKLAEFIICFSPKREDLRCAMYCAGSWENRKKMKSLPSRNSEVQRERDKHINKLLQSNMREDDVGA